MKGRKPTPTRLKVLAGNPGKRKLPKNEPQGSRANPKMPKGLTRAAQSEWKRITVELVNSGVLTNFDVGLLEVTVEAFDDYKRCREKVKKAGYDMVVIGSTGHKVRKKHPLIETMQNAWTRYVTGCREMGCSPSSRTRVSADAPPSVPDESEGQKWKAKMQLVKSSKKR